MEIRIWPKAKRCMLFSNYSHNDICACPILLWSIAVSLSDLTASPISHLHHVGWWCPNFEKKKKKQIRLLKFVWQLTWARLDLVLAICLQKSIQHTPLRKERKAELSHCSRTTIQQAQIRNMEIPSWSRVLTSTEHVRLLGWMCMPKW